MEENQFLRIAGLTNDSIVDGPGLRCVVFVQGCLHNCYKCHNPETHPQDGGKIVSCAEIIQAVKKNPLLDGITFSGGEPFLQAIPLAYIAKQIKNMGLSVISYSGYTFEELISENKNPEWKELLLNLDYLIDGRYIDSQRSLNLRFRGSKNQRIIDVKASLEKNTVVLAEI